MTPTPRARVKAVALGYGDYLRFRTLVQDRYGLHFPEKRRADLEMGVRQAFAASTCTDLDDYYRLLQDADDGAVEMQRLVNALSVGETHFFRDTPQFDALYNHVLPEIIQRRRVTRTLRIWSAGCASGEEPYSIAMMLRDLLPDVDQWAITILGTDVNTQALDRARRGLYSKWAFREARAQQWRARYFRQQDKRYQLIPAVRDMASFTQLNLAADAYPAYETNTTLMDLILCRNVTIYFTESTTRQVVERFYEALTTGGWLAVGHSEPSLITYQRFQVHNFPNTILYQRTGQPTVLPQDWFQPTPPPVAPCLDAPPPPVSAPPAPPVKDSSPPPPKEVDHLERAQELLEYGHSEEARDVLLGLVRDKPRHVLAHMLLGQAYANLGAWAEAERWCREAIRLDTLALDAYYTLALVLQHQEQLDQAIDAMKKVVYIDRNYTLGHFGLADLYYSNGQPARALKSLDNAHRLLCGRPDDEVIPGSGGVTVERLCETIVRRQQQWGAEVNGKA